MPNSTTNPPVEIGIPPWTVATPAAAGVGTITTTAWYYYSSRVFASGSCVASGVNVSVGTTGGVTVRAFLTDIGGNILASSALAGQVLGTASTVSSIPFSTSYPIVGPQAYFIVIQVAANTANSLSVVTQVSPPAGFIGGASADVSAASLATPASGTIAPPTSYTTAKAPLVSLY